MFTPIHLLPQSASSDRLKYRDRWDTIEGQKLHKLILEKIRRGGGENMLEADFQEGRLEFLKDEYDLKGFAIHNETIDFPDIDNFNAIDFSYSEFGYSKFINAHFYTIMAFAKFNGCTFEHCSFVCSSFYGAIFDNVNFIDCDFIEGDSFTNCLFRHSTFSNSFFPGNVFHDCNFDSATSFSLFPNVSITRTTTEICLDNQSKSELFLAIGEAYQAGGASQLSRKFLFLHSQCLTRYNVKGWSQKMIGYSSEYLAGYFLRPMRPILAMSLWFIIVFCLFATQVNSQDALLLSSGALFTFGAKADLLDKMGLIFRIVYVISSFVGISFTALFITVLANISIRSK